uniref:Uncharacterized protein n=1 Tax=Rhodosorus marinus TaxID=101924 RepID=A0A7S3E765_9RHOD|mmetsp:Transcript_14746/g.59927  ORF Transcript_14746/g.59927 Transcript_14746/m.59927 type:complete len:490 (+) Transcript_14746:90-1559(+)
MKGPEAKMTLGDAEGRFCPQQSLKLEDEAKEATSILKNLISKASIKISGFSSERVARRVRALSPEEYLRTYPILYNIFKMNSLTTNIGICKSVIDELGEGVKLICKSFLRRKRDPGLRNLQDCWSRVDLFAKCVQGLFPSAMASGELFTTFSLALPRPFVHSYKAKDFSVDVAVLALARVHLRRRKVMLEEGVLDLLDSAREENIVNLRIITLAMSLLVNADYNPLKEGEGKMCPIVLNGHGGHQFYQSFQEKYMRRKFLSHQLSAAGLMERSTTSSEILKKVDRLRQIEVNICRSLFTFEVLEDHLQLTEDSLDLAFESLICSKLVGMFQEDRIGELVDALALLRRTDRGLAHTKASIASLAEVDWTEVLNVSSGSCDMKVDQPEHMNTCIERLSRVMFLREQTIMLVTSSRTQTWLYEAFLEGLSTAIRIKPREGLPIWQCAVLHVHDVLSLKDLNVEDDDARNRLRPWGRILPVLPNKTCSFQILV